MKLLRQVLCWLRRKPQDILHGEGSSLPLRTGGSRRDRELIDELVRYLERTQKSYNKMFSRDDKKLAIGVVEHSSQVVIATGKPVVWFGLGPHDALQLAESIAQKARAILDRSP